MPDLSQIEWIDGTVYDIKDPVARQQSAGSGAAIVSITRSGTVFTATRADGTSFTFTQKDDDTTYAAGTGIGISGNTISNTAITSLIRVERTVDNITIPANSSQDVVIPITPPTGYQYLACAAIEIRNASDGGTGESHCATGEFHTSDNATQFHAYIHNTGSSAAKILVKIQLALANGVTFVNS